MFVPKTFEELYENLRLATLAEPGPLTNFSQGSNLYILARAVASVMASGYADLRDGVRDSTASTAEGEQLAAHTASFGVLQLQGSLSVGSIIAKARTPLASPVALPAFTTRWTFGDLFYVNTGDVTLTQPYTVIPVSATQIGSAYDLAPGNILLENSGRLNGEWEFVVGNGFNVSNQPVGFIRGGSDRETNEELRSRFIDFLHSLSDGTIRAVRAAILSVPDVESLVLKQYEPGVGWFTAYIDDGTDVPSTALLDAVRAKLDEVKALGIAYRVLGMTKRFVDITTQVKIDPEFTASATLIENTCVERIREALSSYVFGQSLYLSKIAEICHTVPGVLKVTTFLPATDDIALPTEALRAGVVSVTAVL